MLKNFKTFFKALARKEYNLAALALFLFILEVSALIMGVLLLWEMNVLGVMLVQGGPENLITGFVLLVFGNGASIVLVLYYLIWRYPNQARQIENLAFWVINASTT